VEVSGPRLAIDLCKRWEGLHKVGADGLVYPYLCPAGVWTIGYGSTRLSDGSPITKDTPPLTPLECELLLLEGIRARLGKTLDLSPILYWYPSSLGAILSFVYNLGVANYARSTLRKRINEGNWEAAEKELEKWVWAGGRKLAGLLARRKDEAQYLGQ
jgi:lysozyme